MASGTTSSNIAKILSDEETNYLRAAHLIIHICPKAVRKLFDSQHPPSQLTRQLAAKQTTLQKCPGIYKTNWPALFPFHGVAKSSDFDITLLMTLLRNFSKIPPPSTGWDAMPAANDNSEGADIVRIRLYRNQIVHSNEAKLADSDLKVLWTELEDAVDRLSGSTMKTEVNDLQCVVLDQTQRELLLKSIQLERELRNFEEEIKEIKEKHGEEIKEHGEEIKEIKQKHRQEIKKIKEEQNHSVPHNIRDQNTYTIKQWKKDDKVFYETAGYKGALELLNSKNYITIIASPGAGKSTIAKHIALKMENEGWEVIPVYGLDDLIIYGSLDKKQIFVIDDVVGIFSVEMPRLDAFSRKSQEILNLIQNQTKLIMTCRKVVYNEAKKFKSLVTEFVLDLEDSNFQLQDDEKKDILLNHCKAANISPELCKNIPLSGAKVMLPLLCKIFCNDQKYIEKGKVFFERPNECLLEKLEDLKKRVPLQYAGLVLLKMKKVLTKKDCESDENFLSLKKAVFDIYGVNHGTPASEIMKGLSLLDGTYTRPSSDGFTFIHDSIFEIVAYHHGKLYPEHIFKYSSSGYVHNRVTVDDPQSDCSLYIKLEKKHYLLLAERILDDIKTFKLYHVFKNPVLKNGDFLDAFIQMLQRTDFGTFKRIFLQSHPRIQELYTRDELRAKNEEVMWYKIMNLLEKDDVRVIWWIVFYGPTRLLEFVINHVKRHSETNIVQRLINKATNQYSKLLFGKKTEQIRPLLIGCFSGDVDRVRLILQHVNPLCVNTCDYVRDVGYTPLIAACRYGHLSVVDVLIQHGAGVDIRDGCGNIPIITASYAKHWDIVRYLIDHGVDPNLPGYKGNTPLYIASERGHCDTVRYLIDHGADPNLHKYNTPLYIASERGHCNIVKYLIDHNADPNLFHKYSSPPLYTASKRGHCDIVRYLIDHGADPNLHKYNTPLYIASERGHCDIVRYLIDHGADPNIPGKYGNTPLYIALKREHCDIFKYLIDHDANPNIPSEYGNTPLYIASERGHCDIVRYLIDYSADPNIRGMNGHTSIDRALERRHCDIMCLLLDNAADVNISNGRDTSLLQYTLYTSNIDFMKIIMNHINKVKTNEGNNVLYRALVQIKQLELNQEETSRRRRIVYKGSKKTRLCEDLWEVIIYGKCDFMRWLLTLGLDTNNCDKRGRSLLCRMIRHDKVWPSCRDIEEKVKLLLEAGADINIRDDQCLSVIEHARQKIFCYRKEMKKKKYYQREYNKYCNMLNEVKCRVRRYSI